MDDSPGLELWSRIPIILVSERDTRAPYFPLDTCLLYRSYTSDKTQDRRWHNSGLLGFAGIAALVCLLVSNDKVKYVMLCFMTGGMYTTIPLILNWTSETMSQPARKRSVAIALVNSFGHTSFIYGSYLWPSAEGPRNVKGFAMSTAILIFGMVLAALMPVIFRYLPESQPHRVVDGEEVMMEKDEIQERAKC